MKDIAQSDKGNNVDINRTFISQLLDEKELEKFKSSAARDKTILPTIIKIIEHRQKQFNKPSKMEDFQNQAWPLERAFTDGKSSELSWWYDLLTKE